MEDVVFTFGLFQQFRQMNPNMKPRVPGKPIKFESDYDFEQANSKFEELFAKLKVGDVSSANPDAKNEPQVFYYFVFILLALVLFSPDDFFSPFICRNFCTFWDFPSYNFGHPDISMTWN